MIFRLKMTLCMLWLLGVVFGVGGGALITLILPFIYIFYTMNVFPAF